MGKDKEIIREALLKKRKQLSIDFVLEKSKIICQKVLDSMEYGQALRIFIYLNFGNEVITRPIIEDAWARKKEVFVPVTEEDGKMYFVQIYSFEHLEKRKIGVWEPKVNKKKAELASKDDLFLVPGSVFDENGNRFGYGGGYYDRYLADNPQVIKTALCFDFQVLKEIPAEIHDCRMKRIITEKMIIEIEEELS